MNTRKSQRGGFQAALSLETGTSTTLASVATLAITTFYIKFGQYLFVEIPTIYNYLAITVLLVVSLFSCGCLVHMILLGEPSRRELKKEVRGQAKDLALLVEKSFEQIERFEFRCANLPGVVRPSILTKLGAARRIASALERRVHRINFSLDLGSASNITEAFELLNSDLPVDDNCHEQLISSDPIPPLPMKSLLGTMSNLFQKADLEIKNQEAEKHTRRVVTTGYQPGIGYGDYSSDLQNDEDRKLLSAQIAYS